MAIDLKSMSRKELEKHLKDVKKALNNLQARERRQARKAVTMVLRHPTSSCFVKPRKALLTQMGNASASNSGETPSCRNCWAMVFRGEPLSPM